MDKAEVSKKKRRKSQAGKPAKKYAFGTKLKAVKAFSDGIPKKAIIEEIGCTIDTLNRWIAAYKENGEEGLKEKRRGGKAPGPHPEIRKVILETKEKEPGWGSKRISQFMRRFFHLGASPSTTHKVLSEEGKIKPPKKKRRKNPQKPRFFERSTPNQLWQTDIFCFRLNERNAYLIGFIDDYSRFIVGLELFRAQTAENLIELYRRASGEFNKPKEMLTDNGRQYTNWRGTTRFEKELIRDKVKHIRSQPHHPMTLGKIERFWKTIFEEFLSRAQFLSFDDARERLRVWVQYYNHRRPHQGIEGLCPADRYFEIAHELKKTMESEVAENALELALKGKPRAPFYMVGRMNGESVVIQAEKGKVRMRVDSDEGEAQEKEYIVENQQQPSKEESDGKPEEREEAEKELGSHQLKTEVRSDTEALDRECPPSPDMQRIGHQSDRTLSMGETSDRGNASSLGTEDLLREWSGLELPPSASSRPQDKGGKKPEDPTSNSEAGENCEQQEHVEEERSSFSLMSLERSLEPQGTRGNPPSQPDYAGSKRDKDRERCSERAGDIPKNLLSVGEKSSFRNAAFLGTRQTRPPQESDRPGEESPGSEDSGVGEGISSNSDATGSPQDLQRRDEGTTEKKTVDDLLGRS